MVAWKDPIVGGHAIWLFQDVKFGMLTKDQFVAQLLAQHSFTDYLTLRHEPTPFPAFNHYMGLPENAVSKPYFAGPKMFSKKLTQLHGTVTRDLVRSLVSCCPFALLLCLMLG